MYETTYCGHCRKIITRGARGWRACGEDTTAYDCRSTRGHESMHDGADGRPTGPYVLHLGVHLFADDPEVIPAATLGPDFATDGDSWNQWGEPFDGTQRVTVQVDALPADPEEHGLDAARALQALLGIRGVRGRVGDYASYTMDDTRDRSEWEVVVSTCDA